MNIDGEGKMQRTALFVTLSIFLWLCGCENRSLFNEKTYPTTIYPLAAAELQPLKEEYSAQNNFPPCMTLNAYVDTTTGETIRLEQRFDT
jgi:hypothetical protein